MPCVGNGTGSLILCSPVYNPLTIRVPFVLIFGVDTEAPKEQGHKGTTGGTQVWKVLGKVWVVFRSWD